MAENNRYTGRFVPRAFNSCKLIQEYQFAAVEGSRVETSYIFCFFYVYRSRYNSVYGAVQQHGLPLLANVNGII